MKAVIGLRKIIFSFGLLSFLIFSPCAWSNQAQCNNVTRLNVLTINLLFSEVKTREARLQAIADFIQEYEVDVILLQEVVGGSLAKTANSSVDLQTLLAKKGINYNLAYTMANGIPGILSVGNSILSRCEILAHLSWTLPFESEEIFDNFEVPLKRKVLMARLNVPLVGKVHVYDTHLCSYCPPDGRYQQAQVLMAFIKNVEYLFPGDNPIIAGGDFNTDLNFKDDFPVYQLIINNGFTDTYASKHVCPIPNGYPSCCNPADPGNQAGCTFAVDDNPYAFDLFTHEMENPERIDYIFVKGVQGIEASTVVFNEAPFVSDHSGVLSTVRLK
jgi:maltose 6'-phosphate phosphatase